MSIHEHPPGTPPPPERDCFLVDHCPRCAEYADDLGLPFDAERFAAFWRKMVDVEYRDRGGYGSDLDQHLGRRLYYVSLALQRSFGLDPATLKLDLSWPMPRYDRSPPSDFADTLTAVPTPSPEC